MPQGYLDPSELLPAGPARAGGGSGTSYLDPSQLLGPDEAPGGGSRWGDYAGMAVRGLGGVLGSEGLLPGALINGGADLLAQTLERFAGTRKHYNLYETSVNAAAGAVPLSRLLKEAPLAARLAGAALHGAGSSAALDVANQLDAGKSLTTLDLGEAARATSSGLLFGTGGGLLGEGLARAGAAASPTLAKLFGRAAPALNRLSRGEIDAALEADPNLPRTASYTIPRTAAKGEMARPGTPASITVQPGRVPAARAEQPPLTSPILTRMMELAREAENAGAVDYSGRGGVPPATPIDLPPLPTNVEGYNPFEGFQPSGNRGMRMPDEKAVPVPPSRIPSSATQSFGLEPSATEELAPLDPLRAFTKAGRITDVNVDTVPKDTVRGAGYRARVLGESGAGSPGLNVEYHPDPATPGQMRMHVVYRAPDGQPVMTAILARGEDGRLAVSNLASAEGRGLLTGRAAKAVTDKLQELDAARPYAGISPDAEGVLRRLTGQEAPAATSPAGSELTAPPSEPNLPAALQAAEAAAPSSTPKLFVPAEHVSAWAEIRRRMAEKPGTGNIEPDVISMSRRIQEEPNPRRLWNLERGAKKAAEARVPERLLPPGTGGERLPTTADQMAPGWPKPPSDAGGEAGGIDPALLRVLGIHLGGGLAGGTTAAVLSSPDQRRKNVLMGTLLGAAAPTLYTNPGAAARLRYFSLLARAAPQIKNVIGNVGNVGARAAEEALTGNTPTAKDLLRSIFSRETLDQLRTAFREAGDEMPQSLDSTRWGQTSGALGLPSRTMHAVDEAATGSLTRAGLPEEEARTVLFTGKPRSETGQLITKLARKIPALVPFARTAMNSIERGLEHTPGVGFLPEVAGMRGDSIGRQAARQALGALAMMGGAAGAKALPAWLQPYAAAASGPLAVPYSMGLAMRQAYTHRGDPFSNVVQAPINTIREMLPLPSSDYPWNVGRYLAGWVPGMVGDASLVSPSAFSTSHSVFDPTIAKIPGLNSALLPRKRGGGGRAAGGGGAMPQYVDPSALVPVQSQ